MTDRVLTAEARLEQVIAEIVDDLFTNGSGEEAYRLVLTSRDGRDLGGWGRGPMRDRILSRWRSAHGSREAE